MSLVILHSAVNYRKVLLDPSRKGKHSSASRKVSSWVPAIGKGIKSSILEKTNHYIRVIILMWNLRAKLLSGSC